MTLSDAAEAIEISQDVHERAAILSGLLANASELAKIYKASPDKFGAFQIRVAAIRGMAGMLKDFMRTIRVMAKAIPDPPPPRSNPTDLDDLTKPLGISGLMSPFGYQINITGVWLDEDRVATEPIIVVGIATDIETEAERLDLAWRWRGKWRTRSIERSAAMDPRRLQKLADYGFPASTENASAVVRYLQSFEAENVALIPHRGTVTRMGWTAAHTFQLGEQSIGDNNVLVAEGGLSDMAQGWQPKGDWAEWRRVISRHLRDRPQVQLGIYAAAVAPLLRVLDVDGFVIDWSGATSRGKTSALRVAASTWGDPDRLVGSWGTASVVGPQESAAFLHSLPLILDDTKQVGHRSDIVARMLYDLPGGRERLRGQAGGGLRKVKTWRTVMLSTGEKAVTDFSEDAGARARSLCIRGAPFGKDCTANRKATEELVATVRANHGHLGIRLIRYLVEEADHGALRQVYADLRDSYAESAGGSVSRRLAASVAAIHLAGQLCHDLGCPNEDQLDDAMAIAWDAAMQSGENSDRPAAAWHAINSWCVANADRFDGSRRPSKDPPSQGWAGRWDSDELGIFPQVVKELLERWGYDRDYCLNEWARRGWLDHAPGRKTKRIRVDSRPSWLLVFRAAAIRDDLGEPQD